MKAKRLKLTLEETIIHYLPSIILGGLMVLVLAKAVYDYDQGFSIKTILQRYQILVTLLFLTFITLYFVLGKQLVFYEVEDINCSDNQIREVLQHTINDNKWGICSNSRGRTLALAYGYKNPMCQQITIEYGDNFLRINRITALRRLKRTGLTFGQNKRNVDLFMNHLHSVLAKDNIRCKSLKVIVIHN